MFEKTLRRLVTILVFSLLPLVIPDGKVRVIAQSSAEAELRALIEQYFAAYGREDQAAIERLWSDKAPASAPRKKALEKLFADHDRIEVRDVSVRSIKTEGDAARVRLSVELSAVEAATGKPAAGFGKQSRLFQLVKEAGGWKIVLEESSESALVAALVAARNNQDRTALLDEDKELLSAQLCVQLLNEGRSFLGSNRHTEALILFETARTVAERLADKKNIEVALNGIAGVHVARGDLKAALEPTQQALKLAEASGDSSTLADLQASLCTVQQRLGNYDEASELCKQSLALAEATGNRVVMARAFNVLGNVAIRRSQYAAAMEFYGKALALEEAIGNKRRIGQVLNNLGVANNAIGNATGALQYYLRSLPIAEEIGNKAGVAGTLNNISMIYRALGNYKLALEYSQRSLVLSEAIGDKAAASSALEGLGNLHAQAGEHARALDHFRRSLALAEQTGERSQIAVRLVAVGYGYENLGEDDRAIECYRRGLTLAESIGASYTAVACLGNIGQIHLKHDRLAEAVEMAERAVALTRQEGAHDNYWQALLIAGTAYRRLKQYEPARQRLEESIRVIETARAQLAAGEPEQASFFEARFDPYVQMVMLLSEQGRASEAFSFAERSKARVLLDVLQGGRSDISKALSEQEKEQENRLRAELNSISSQLRSENEPARDDKSRVDELKAKQSKARLAYENFRTQLYLAHPELRIKRGEAQTVAVEQTGGLLSDGRTALLEYVVADDRTLMFVLTASAQKGLQKPVVKLYELRVKRTDLVERVQNLTRRIANNDLEFDAKAKDLYNLLIAPARDQLQGKTRIVIVPDDILWETPFQALRGVDGRFLIQSAAISYAPSLTVLREIDKPRKPTKPQAATTLLAMGNPKLAGQTVSRSKNVLMSASFEPLPDAERLVKGLEQIYGTKASKVYVGSQAREDVLKAEAGGYRILQLATHGVLNNASPMYSHVMLAQSDTGKEDGLLEAWEIMQMDLQAELAVLSACETARGRIGAGEGVIGLAWALFVAGCPTTVVSQWKVESISTTELMLAFHRNLRAGASKAESMRQASLKLMTDKRFDHPFYWAGFIVVGNGK